MTRALIIARQEFVKFVTRRGFLFTLIGVPLWIGLAAIVPSKLSPPPDRTATFAIIDHSGDALPVIIRALDKRQNQGGHDLILVPPPKALSGVEESQFGSAASKYLRADNARADAAVLIPKNFDADHAAQFWSTKDAPGLREFLRNELTTVLRLRALRRLGVSQAQAALDVEAGLSAHMPPSRTVTGPGTATSMGVSVAMAILLLIIALMNSMSLLQGVIEEKSTRMIEVLLSCATPWEIVTGKIMGVIAVAFFTILIWVSAVAIVGSLFAAQTAGAIIIGLLHALADPTLLPLIVLYFVCGLLIYGAIFLSIGSVSASLADAQSYLGPSMMMIMLPNLFISPILRAPDSTLAVVASYIPIYTPYIMLLRIGAHPPALEVVTTALLAIAAAGYLVWKSGSIFANHALATEKPPRLLALFRRAPKV